MAVEALVDADAAALPAGSSFCTEAAVSFRLPPIPPSSSSPSSAQLPRSGSSCPASPQPAAATVAACLPASLALRLLAALLPLFLTALLFAQL